VCYGENDREQQPSWSFQATFAPIQLGWAPTLGRALAGRGLDHLL